MSTSSHKQRLCSLRLFDPEKSALKPAAIYNLQLVIIKLHMTHDSKISLSGAEPFSFFQRQSFSPFFFI